MEMTAALAALSIVLPPVTCFVEDCYGMPCINGGSVILGSTGQCQCSCMEGYTGLACATKLESSQWPQGPYSLIMSKYGCPETVASGWKTGTVNVATTLFMWMGIFRVDGDGKTTYRVNMEDPLLAQQGVFNTEKNVYLGGPFRENGFTLSFCTKSAGHPSTNVEVWPPAVEMVYRTGGQCPDGFKDGDDLVLEVPGLSALNIDGELPDLTTRTETQYIGSRQSRSVTISIRTCSRRNEDTTRSNVNATYGHFILQASNGTCTNMTGYSETFENVTAEFAFLRDGAPGAMLPGAFRVEYCFYRLIKPSDVKVLPQTDDISDIDTLYQIPFTTRNKREPFVRSRLLHGMTIHSKSPSEPADGYIVNDMYGIYSYTDRINIYRDMEGFQCTRSTSPVVPLGALCDGIPDCKDGSDEHVANCYLESKPLFNIPLDGSTAETQPWITFKLQSSHAVGSVFVSLKRTEGEQLDTFAASKNLISPGISVSHAADGFWNHGARFVDFESFIFMRANLSSTDYYPQVDETPFPVPHFVVEHRFTSPAIGQYVMIHVLQHKMGDDDKHTIITNYFNRMVGVHVMSAENEFIRQCRDLTELRQYQLASSSNHLGHSPYNSGLYDSGWCAESTDLAPYLQIDLILPTIVSGIKLKNWQILTAGLQSFAVKAFEVHHGFDENELIPYGNTFEVGISQAGDLIRTYMFHKPFFARFIRLIPTPQGDGMPCLKMELITCEHQENNAALTMNCSDTLQRVAVNTTETFASFNEPTRYVSITTLAECRDTCLTSGTYCSIFGYHSDYQLCLVYSYNSTANMRVVTIDENDTNVTLTAYFCRDEVVNTMVNDGQRIYKQLQGERLIQSIGYPIGYDRGEITTWLINVDESKFVRMFFTNISLNVYQEKGCIDTISISESQVARFYAERQGDAGPIQKTITSLNNGEAVNYWGKTSRVYVTFETCDSSLLPLFVGRGWRVLIRQSETAFCYGGWAKGNMLSRECLLPGMQFASPTYLDSTRLALDDDVTMLYYVRITAPLRSNARYIELRFHDFEIPCNTDHLQFAIIDRGDLSQRRYCTFDQPPRIYKTALWEVSIQLYYNYYTYQLDYMDDKWHGFHGSYTFVYTNETMFEWVTSIEDSPLSWRPGSQYINALFYRKVCSERLQSCYTIYPTQSRRESNDAGQNMCNKEGHNLVSLNTADEYKLVRLLAENYTRQQELFSDSFTHIQGDSVWLTDVHIAFRDESNWYTHPCNGYYGSKAAVFICEKPMNDNSSVQQPNTRLGSYLEERVEPREVLDRFPAPFRCGSGEYLSWLSLCNGVHECEDKSDEQDCNLEEECGSEEFRCNNGRCITYNKMCDRVVDCSEGEDETCYSAESFFTCDNLQKIDVYVRCNGIPECFDGSDESNCGQCRGFGQILCRTDDSVCLPKALTCDGYTECSENQDEANCQEVFVETCGDWWILGHRESGIYNVGGELVECDFSSINRTWNINTFIPFHLVMNYREDVYGNLGANSMSLVEQPYIEWFLERDVRMCNIMVIETGQPALRSMLMEDGRPENSDRVISSVTVRYPGDLSTASYSLQGHIGLTSNKTVTTGKRLQYKPVRCYSTHPPHLMSNAKATIPCVGGYQSITADRLCLYDQTSYLDFGCRSLSHLWECADFECPQNYVKCPGSFCLAWAFICDGRKHCPHGEDEENCHCTGDDIKDIIFVVNRFSDLPTRTRHRLSQQFITKLNTINIFEMYDFRYRFNPGFPAEIETVQLGRVLTQKVDYNLRAYVARNVDSYTRKPPEVFNDTIYRHFRSIKGSPRRDREDPPVVPLGNITDEQLAKVEIIVIDDRIDDENTVWDTLFVNDVVPERVVNKPYRVLIDGSVTGLASLDERRDRLVYKVKSLDYLEHAGALLFDRICKVNRTGACMNKFQCEASGTCIPLHLVCDGTRQCPYGDDERICSFSCPPKCTCRGYIVNCRNSSMTYQDVYNFRNVYYARSLDLSFSPNISETNSTFRFPSTTFILKLNLSNCRIIGIGPSSFTTAKQLRVLDLSNNLLTAIPTYAFIPLESLLTIHLSGNKLINFLGEMAFTGLLNIRMLTLVDTDLTELSTRPFRGLELDQLDLSNNKKLTNVKDSTFSDLRARRINLEHSPIKSFTVDMFTGVSGVEEMQTSAYKFCCIRPPTVDQSKCTPYQDEFSSCEDLMRDLSQRALLWVIGLVALIGNTLVILYRLVYDRSHLKLGYGIFVTNLAVSDFFMGLYLVIIGIADQLFRDRYIWLDEYWRHSGWCTFAGVLSTVSSESSIMFMCLITIDRILVIKFPFGQFRFRPLSSMVCVSACWFTVACLSLLPIFHTDYFQDQFYSKSGVCIALPLTRERYPGWLYSIVIFVGLNFVTFVLIAIGQLLIFKEVRKSGKRFKAGKSTRVNDLKIARNLLLVVSTDFLCWGPVGIMGMMSLAGHSIPPSVYSWTAVLILPVNSALNPFLYTLSALLTRKGFKPRLQEQSTLDPGALALMRKMLKFRNSLVALKNSEASDGRALGDILFLDAGDIGRVALQMALCLRFLHKTHMRMGDLGKGSVFLSGDAQGDNDGVKVQVKFDAKLSSSVKEKGEDMYKFGQIIQYMMEQHSK